MSDSVAVLSGSLQPKQILAKDVFSANGALLIGAGTELTQRLIDVIGRQNIEKVMIKSAVDEEALHGALDLQYLLVAEQPLMQQLKQLIVNYRVGGE